MLDMPTAAIAIGDGQRYFSLWQADTAILWQPLKAETDENSSIFLQSYAMTKDGLRFVSRLDSGFQSFILYGA